MLVLIRNIEFDVICCLWRFLFWFNSNLFLNEMFGVYDNNTFSVFNILKMVSLIEQIKQYDILCYMIIWYDMI